MKKMQWFAITAAGAAAIVTGGVASLVQAQTPAVAAAAAQECTRTRAEVRNECIAFLKTHQWDEMAGDWVPKAGGKPAVKLPEGVTSRAKIRAERDAFLRANKWNDATAQWEPLGAKTRDVSKLSRDEVRKETQAFMRTHYWDEALSGYVLKGK